MARSDAVYDVNETRCDELPDVHQFVTTGWQLGPSVGGATVL